MLQERKSGSRTVFSAPLLPACRIIYSVQP